MISADIEFSLLIINKYYNNLNSTHFPIIIKILRYIKSILDKGMLFYNKELKLTRFTNANYGLIKKDKKSTSR